MLKRLLLLLILSCSLQAQMCYSTRGLSAYQLWCGDENWPLHLDFDALCFSPWRAAETATLFAPFWQLNDNLFFLQGTAGHFHDDMWVASIGGGGRSQYSPNFACGINAFADYGYSDEHLNWWQFGFGAEAFGGCWEARVNAYVPGWFKARVASDHTVFQNTISGTTVTTLATRTIKTETGRWGFDTEAGAGFPIGQGALWGFAGFFRFRGTEVPILQGPRLRLQWRMNLPLCLGNVEAYVGADWQHDKVYGQQTSLNLHMLIPFSCFKCCTVNNIYRQMGRSVCRMPGIVIKDKQKVTTKQSQVGLFFFDQGGLGSGTQTNPTNLTTAVASSAPGDFLFALNDTGTITNPFPAGVPLTAAQKLYAFPASTPVGGTVLLDLGGGNFLPITALPANPGATIDQAAAGPNVLLSSNNLIHGPILSRGTIGLQGTGGSGLTVQQTSFTGQTAAGISLVNFGGRAMLTNNSMTTITGNAFVLNNAAQTLSLTFSNNTITNALDGILINSGANDNLSLLIQNNTLTSMGASGISIQKAGSGGAISGVITGNTMQNILGPAGIFLSSSNTTSGSTLAYNIKNNSVTNATQSAFAINAASSGTTTMSFSALYQNNSSTQTLADAFTATSNMISAGDALTISYQSNTIRQAATAAISCSNGSAGTLNATLTSNDDTAGLHTQPAYPLTNIGNGTIFGTLTNNNTDRGANLGIVLTNSLIGTFKATNFTTLSSLNNNISVTNPAGIITNTTTNCPTPVVPSVP
ncbi:MAG: inverse autotransporter beta domain-containing protein [Verrucomicrobia bacterium]|nr:inverse autotransporter beta domain-containing protein [Verrucomicrobiota bacterium]